MEFHKLLVKTKSTLLLEKNNNGELMLLYQYKF